MLSAQMVVYKLSVVEEWCADQLVLFCMVLFCRAGELGEALALMQEATQNMSVDGTSAVHIVTMGYNLARLQEASGEMDQRPFLPG